MSLLHKHPCLCISFHSPALNSFTPPNSLCHSRQNSYTHFPHTHQENTGECLFFVFVWLLSVSKPMKDPQTDLLIPLKMRPTTFPTSYPKHLSEVRVSEAEGDVWDMEAFGGPFGLCGVTCGASCSCTSCDTLYHRLPLGCLLRLTLWRARKDD